MLGAHRNLKCLIISISYDLECKRERGFINQLYIELGTKMIFFIIHIHKDGSDLVHLFLHGTKMKIPYDDSMNCKK